MHRISKKQTPLFIMALVAMAALLSVSQVAYAQTFQAATSLTVVNVSKWDSPDCTKYSKKDNILKGTQIGSGYTSFNWTSPWVPDIPRLNNASGRIWAIQCDQNNGRSCRAIAWDWIGNTTTAKNNSRPYSSKWVGIMLSTVCGTDSIPPAPHKTCTNQKYPERSNIMFTTNPFGTGPY